VLDEPLLVVDVPPLIEAGTVEGYTQTRPRVNDSVVRLGILKGEYHWHKHDDEDEFFFLVEGRFIVDLENRSVELAPRQGITIPRGVVHRTRAPERSIVLMMEGAGVVPTGD
jgi:mannose-6-phosphate isomerase-like protein (cupin superfamily)